MECENVSNSANRKTVRIEEFRAVQEELEALKQNLGPLAAILQPKPAVTEDAEAPAPEVKRIPLDLEGTMIAEYEAAGPCLECGAPTYKCVSHPVRADHIVDNALAVFVPGGPKEKPLVYCQRHSPHRKHQLAQKSKPVAANGELLGEAWRPVASGPTLGL